MLTSSASFLFKSSASEIRSCGEVAYSNGKIAPLCAFSLNDGSWILSYSLASSVRASNGVSYSSVAKLDCKSKDYHIFRNIIKSGTIASEYKAEVQSLLKTFCSYVSRGKVTKQGFYK